MTRKKAENIVDIFSYIVTPVERSCKHIRNHLWVNIFQTSLLNFTRLNVESTFNSCFVPKNEVKNV